MTAINGSKNNIVFRYPYMKFAKLLQIQKCKYLCK